MNSSSQSPIYSPLEIIIFLQIVSCLQFFIMNILNNRFNLFTWVLEKFDAFLSWSSSHIGARKTSGRGCDVCFLQTLSEGRDWRTESGLTGWMLKIQIGDLKLIDLSCLSFSVSFWSETNKEISVFVFG